MVGRALLGGRVACTAAAREVTSEVWLPFSRAGVGELGVCISPCLGEHGSVQQALGRFGAGLSHRESFKDVIYARTHNFLARINPKHWLLALSALKETRLSPTGCSGTLLMPGC